MSIFEQASVQKLRFSSERGELTVEQLWDVPLQSRNQFDLDTIAKTVNQQLKNVTEESFVNVNTNPAKAKYELMLEIVKHIIGVKLETAAAGQLKLARAKEREKLIAILGEKQDSALKSLSVEELSARLAELA